MAGGVSIADLVGRAVWFTPTHGSTHHGLVVRATYNTLGEAAVVVRLDDHPVSCPAQMVLVGPDAEAVVAAELGGPGRAA